MRVFGYFYLAVFFLLPLKEVWGGDVLSLHSALEKASQKNLTLEASRQELGVSKGQFLQASAIPNPQVSLSVTQVPFSHLQWGDTARDIGLQQPIELWGKRSLRVQAARSDYESNQFKYHSLELDIFKQVKEAYWNLSLADEQVELALENLKFQQRFLSRVQDHFQVGKASLSDLTRAKVEMARASNDVFEGQKNVAMAQSLLNRLMGEDIKSALSSPTHLNEMDIQVNEEELIKRALEFRPEREALQKLKEGSQAELSLARRLIWAPDLNAQVTYQKGERNDSQDSWGGGVGLTFPLWNHYKGERLSASSKMDSLATMKNDLDQQISLEVHQAVLEIKLSQEQLHLWKEAVDDATESARLAEQQYLEGDVDLLVFFQARRELIQVTLKYLESLKNLQVNQASLERAVGKDLS